MIKCALPRSATRWSVAACASLENWMNH
jgi:hypothetical protein